MKQHSEALSVVFVLLYVSQNEAREYVYSCAVVILAKVIESLSFNLCKAFVNCFVVTVSILNCRNISVDAKICISIIFTVTMPGHHKFVSF